MAAYSAATRFQNSLPVRLLPPDSRFCIIMYRRFRAFCVGVSRPLVRSAMAWFLAAPASLVCGRFAGLSPRDDPLRLSAGRAADPPQDLTFPVAQLVGPRLPSSWPRSFTCAPTQPEPFARQPVRADARTTRNAFGWIDPSLKLEVAAQRTTFAVVRTTGTPLSRA